MSILRAYQRQAVDACWEAITPEVNRVAVEMATGLGKTITFAGLLDEWLNDRYRRIEIFPREPIGRVLVLVHTDDLVRQTVETVEVIAGNRWTIGVVKAGQNEIGADIIVASVQTLAQSGRREQITDVGLIVVDEAHHATARTYMDILNWFGAFSGLVHGEPGWRPGTPTFGFTATLARSDGVGLGQVWQDLAFSRSLVWGMRHGYLVDMVPYSILIPGVNGAASDKALDAQLAESIAPEAVVTAWIERFKDVALTVSTILFAPLVRSAEAFADAFNAAGVKAEVVAGAYSDEHNRAVRARYEAGVTTVVCNAMKWTEGTNVPRTKCVIIARPTKSKPLLVQMAGRGLRPWLTAEAPPREDQRCTLLVVAGAETDFFGMVADLSDNAIEPAAGKSLLAMEDEWDLGKDLPSEDAAYAGPVRVEQWDALVQQSSKAWKYTDGGVPFLPTAKRRTGYVFIVDTARGFEVWAREVQPLGGHTMARRVCPVVPDLELAMALAEDEAQERGGDIGALLADKSRAWRKAVPSLEMLAQARRVGVDESAIARIMSLKSAGKAGKLSDLIDRATASRALDRNAEKIRERAKA